MMVREIWSAVTGNSSCHYRWLPPCCLVGGVQWPMVSIPLASSYDFYVPRLINSASFASLSCPKFEKCTYLNPNFKLGLPMPTFFSCCYIRTAHGWWFPLLRENSILRQYLEASYHQGTLVIRLDARECVDQKGKIAGHTLWRAQNTQWYPLYWNGWRVIGVQASREVLEKIKLIWSNWHRRL